LCFIHLCLIKLSLPVKVEVYSKHKSPIFTFITKFVGTLFLLSFNFISITMSIEIIEKKNPFLKENIYFTPNNDFFNLSYAIIPFSDFFKKNPCLDIYVGMENIPFEERDPEYKKILQNEFL